MNYMKQVAEMLGVEMGEVFNIKDEGKLVLDPDTHKPLEYFFDNGGLICATSNSECIGRLVWLLNETQSEIVKLPWKLKEKDTFFYITLKKEVGCTSFNPDFTRDIALLCMGNCFRTEAEAEVHKDEILQKMNEVLGK